MRARNAIQLNERNAEPEKTLFYFYGFGGCAALPRRTGQGGADSGDQIRVGVAGDQDDAGQAAGDQAAKNASQPAPSLVGSEPMIFRWPPWIDFWGRPPSQSGRYGSGQHYQAAGCGTTRDVCCGSPPRRTSAGSGIASSIAARDLPELAARGLCHATNGNRKRFVVSRWSACQGFVGTLNAVQRPTGDLSGSAV